MLLGAGTLEPADPPPAGPTTWGLAQWGFVLALVLFLLLASAAISHVARPRRPSELPPQASRRSTRS